MEDQEKRYTEYEYEDHRSNHLESDNYPRNNETSAKRNKMYTNRKDDYYDKFETVQTGNNR